jgi:hypothetical protein
VPRHGNRSSPRSSPTGCNAREPLTESRDDLGEHLTQLPHTKVLEDAGFVFVGHYEFPEIHDWTPAALIGFVYSTSLLPRSVLGDRTRAFAADLRERLREVEPSGVFREHASFAFDLAHRPPAN